MTPADSASRSYGVGLGVIGIARIVFWQRVGLYDYGAHWPLVALTGGLALTAIVTFGSMVGLRAGAEDNRVHKLIGVALPIGMRDVSFLHNAKKSKLLISGDHDNYSPVSGLQDLITKMPDPKSLVIVDGADHFFWGLEGKIAKAAAEFLQH